MVTYNALSWVILRVNSPEYGVFYKLIANVNHNWRLNSGITKVEFDPDKDIYVVHGNSGSKYLCPKDKETLDNVTQRIFDGVILNEEVSKVTMQEYLNSL